MSEQGRGGVGDAGLTQTILATPELVEQGVYGNCMQAAIATVLSKPMDAVPHFGAFASWPYALRLWLRGEGLDYTIVSAPPIPNERAMLCGKSPRGHAHAVVSEGGRIVWDPHPSRDGLTEVSGAYVIHEWDTTESGRLSEFERLGAEAAYHAMWHFFLRLPHSPFSDLVQREAMRLKAALTPPADTRNADGAGS